MDIILFLTFIVSGCLYAIKGQVMFSLGCFFISAVFWMAYKISYTIEKASSFITVKEFAEKFINSLKDGKKIDEK